jgi:mono/diheme cytochrome c family protein
MTKVCRTIICTLLLMLARGAAASADEAENPLSRGEYLARAGDCVACHSVPGGKAFAGGLKMGSPLGAIYSTNITPDQDTGIGGYSLANFDRAVRGGTAKDGHRLYPAMPYPSYAKLTDEDVRALYDFFMKEVPPVRQANLANEIPWLLSFRWPLAVWNLVFTTSGSYVDKSGHDAGWNRGAYLVQGLGHCGACHTARGFAFQEKALDESGGAYLAGAMLDGWSAPNLHGDLRTGLGQWSQADLAEFLKTGHNRDGSAFGSMTDVVNNSTPYLSDEDLCRRAWRSPLMSMTARPRRRAAGNHNRPGRRLSSAIAARAMATTAAASAPICRGSPAIPRCSTATRRRSSMSCSTAPRRWWSRARPTPTACRSSACNSTTRRSRTS